MKNKKLVIQGVIFVVGILSVLCPIEDSSYSAKQVQANIISNEQEVSASVLEQSHNTVRTPQIIFIEPETEVVTEPEAEPETEVKKPYNYYRVNDNGCYAQLDLELQDFLWEMCEKYDISEHYELIMAQMFSESSFKVDIISKSNDYGLMQINKCNHGWLSEILGSDDFTDPYISIEAGCLMISDYLHKYDIAPALVAYNRGESVVKNGVLSSSYSDMVIGNMKKLEVIEVK